MRRKGDDVKLSPREASIALLFIEGKGLSNREVAAALKIAENTVYTHVQKMYRAIEVTTRAEFVLWLAQHPRALHVDTPQWADWRIHPVGCECSTLSYCKWMRQELGNRPVNLAA